MIAVSMCLLGVNCTYAGGNNENPELVKLFKQGRVVPVCPEQLGGLTTPRAPAEIINGSVINDQNVDVTDAFKSGAKEAARMVALTGCETAILKARSPSCGCERIYDGTFTHTVIQGDGVFTQELKKMGITTYTEETMNLDNF